MTLTDWYRDHVRDGEGWYEASYQLWIGAMRRASRVYDPGTHVFDKDWDVLLILDACRWDLMESVEDEWNFFDCDETIWSVGSSSPEWIQKTFDEPRDVSYITGNPFSAEVLDTNNVSHLDEVWADTWSEEHETILPESLTDRAISHWRNDQPNQMVVHYMQPHYPFVPSPIASGIELDSFGEMQSKDVWEALRHGETTRDEVWDAYRENLNYVLSSVELLLSSIDADTVAITADHGNSMGEKGIYGHVIGVPTKEQRKVPWCVTSASDTSDYTPQIDTGDVDSEVESRLEDLGYV
jgi:hypothetical protein